MDVSMYPVLEYHGERNHVATYLNSHRWHSVVTPISQLFADDYYCASILPG